jgi:hypothetical protein
LLLFSQFLPICRPAGAEKSPLCVSPNKIYCNQTGCQTLKIKSLTTGLVAND